VRDQITAIAIQPQGRYQAIGNEKSVVSVVDSLEGNHRPIQLWRSPIELPISHLGWSGDGDYLACSELAGQVVVKRVQVEPSLTWTVASVFERRLLVREDGISQILLNDDGSKFFVKNGPEVAVWSIGDEKDTVVSIEAAGSTWIEHPSNSSLLIAFSSATLQLHRWDDLTVVASVRVDGASALTSSLSIGYILSAPGRSQLIIHTSRSDGVPAEVVTSFFEVPPLDRFAAPLPPPPTIAHDIPADVQQQIELPLGLLPVQGFIFLDKNYWVCSYHLGPSTDKQEVQRYYFLPKDWLNVECLRLCALLANGTLLLPNNGELAVIKCAALR
jgi:hypothetical protein